MDVNARPPVKGILEAIGQTPLVELERYLVESRIRVWAKLEAANPGGSAKDRPAAQMLSDALEQRLVGPGSTVIESTSGNMGGSSRRRATWGSASLKPAAITG